MQKRNPPTRGYKRKPRDGIPILEGQRAQGESQSTSGKRKSGEDWENGEFMQGALQNNSKKQKKGTVQIETVNNATVEVASRDWPQVSK